jgi:hypothetical protein
MVREAVGCEREFGLGCWDGGFGFAEGEGLGVQGLRI